MINGCDFWGFDGDCWQNKIICLKGRMGNLGWKDGANGYLCGWHEMERYWRNFEEFPVACLRTSEGLVKGY